MGVFRQWPKTPENHRHVGRPPGHQLHLPYLPEREQEDWERILLPGIL